MSKSAASDCQSAHCASSRNTTRRRPDRRYATSVSRIAAGRSSGFTALPAAALTPGNWLTPGNRLTLGNWLTLGN
jgi:hypothetical protein